MTLSADHGAQPEPGPARATAGPAGDAEHHPLPRRTLHLEMATVVFVSLGASAVWAILSLVEVLTRPEVKLSQTTTRMNTNRVPDRLWLDFLYQFAGVTLKLAPVVLVLYLLSRNHRWPHRWIGFDLRRPVKDLLHGVLLAAVIGIPGLGIYLAGRELGINMTVAPANLKEVWWAVPMLIAAAIQNALLEEVVGPGYLITRMKEAGWASWLAVGATSLLRGLYHLYQGFGQFIGNFLMGVVFGAWFLRTRRVMPLVIAHGLIDIIVFVGFTYLKDSISWLQ